MKRLVTLLAALALLVSPLAAQQALQFHPKVGAIGARVTVTGSLPPGSEVHFGTHRLTVLGEDHGFSFMVPPNAVTAFIEVVRGGRVVARSAVPFVVTGTSLVQAPRLIGLKEAIDVFGYSETLPEGARKPEVAAKPVLRLDDEDVLTIGEPAPAAIGPAVALGDSASAAKGGMGPAGFLITARAPRKKYQIPTPTPPPAP